MKYLFFILSIFCLFSCRKYELKHAHENINTLNKDIIQLEPILIGNDSVKMTGYLRIGKRNKIYAVIVDSLPFVNGDNSKLIGKEVSSLKGKFANEIAADFYQVNENVLYHSFFVDAQNTHPLQNRVAYPIKSNSYLFEITEGRISYNLGGSVQDKELQFNTISPLNITNTGAKLRLVVTRLNPSLTIQQFGFYIGKNTIPSNSDRAVIIGVPFSIADFNSEEASLESGTTYFYRAFVNTDKGNYLGDVIKFKTLSVDNTARLETIASIDSNNYKIDLRCNVLNMKQTVIKSCGFVYDTVAVPSINQTKLVSNLANFKDSINNYSGNKTYYIRSFIETNEGVVYGNQEIRYTPIRFPVVVTNTSTNLNGAITNTGGGTITQKGFCWSLSSDPTIKDSILVNINSSNTFSNTLPLNLPPNTTYYFRAFAINEKGVGYGIIKTYLTSKAKPILLTDLAVSNITSTAAMLNNTVLTNGGDNITSQGFCFATTPNPSVSNSKQLQTPILQTGLVNNNIVGFLPSTTYYVRAFSTNRFGTTYSNEVSFTTLSGLPVLNSTNTSSSISYSSFSINYGITSIGAAPIDASGIMWSESNSNPTFNNTNTFTNNHAILQTGTSSGNVLNLKPLTEYYVVSYATNSYGTVYSNVMTVTTLSGLADIITNPSTKIGTTSFTANATIINNKGLSITNSGFVWSKNPNPTIPNGSNTTSYDYYFGTTNQNGDFTFTKNYLIPSETYYLRAYVKTKYGTSYGNEIVITTLNGLVDLTTNNLQSSSYNYAVVSGSILNNKGYTITNSGFVWDMSPLPTYNSNNNKNSFGTSFQTGDFLYYIENLQPSRTYYVRSFATNQYGTNYGNEITFTTKSAIATVRTNLAYSITSTFFNISGTILNKSGNDGYTITNSGFVYDINPNPTIVLSTKTTNNSSYQYQYENFSSKITNLQPNTTYYIRAYVTNSYGTSYGEEVVVTTSKSNEVEPLTVSIPASTFSMGSDRSINEQPIHTVTISTFSIMKYEVTFDQYDIFCESTGKAKPDDAGWGRGTRPVINVSWNDANAYATWLSQQTGKNFRLPTEAEWEYTARGGQSFTYAGSDNIDEIAWYTNNSNNQTNPVGAKIANSYGLYDMSGNVREWCSDWDGPYGSSNVINPQGPSSGIYRVWRGGSSLDLTDICRVAFRSVNYPTDFNQVTGFRLVLEQ